ncbi:hypothetical protein MHU86_6565 [Fragilaria crotonensis]|nr:hypothetical protein MHU86_6565 [Fragilaria crotonensis]
MRCRLRPHCRGNISGNDLRKSITTNRHKRTLIYKVRPTNSEGKRHRKYGQHPKRDTRRRNSTAKEEMAELLMLHHQYGHVPMKKLQTMAEQGILPRRLAKCRTPICTACLYAKATRRPWRGKTRKNLIDEGTPVRPGQIVSVDQLVSPTPGLIAQMTGFLTTKRYKYATVYVDQFSRMGYVYLQKTASAEKLSMARKLLSGTQSDTA